jgi:hypothetical protein
MSKRLALLLSLVVLSPSPAHAVFHFISISEVFAGGGAAPRAQFVELRAYSGFQEQGGKVCWEPALDCFAWGAHTGPPVVAAGRSSTRR